MRRIPLLGLAMLVGCSSQAPDVRPSGLPLGIAFPPVADREQRAFTIDQLGTLGIRHVRIGQQWALREPERDVHVWRPLEDRLSALEDAGVEVFLTFEIKGLPDWLGALSAGEQEDEFREYVRELLRRVGAVLDWVQFGNEWNTELERFAGGDVETFIRLANVLHDEVQRLPSSSRPEVALSSFSIGGLHELAFLQGRIGNVVLEGGPLYSAAEIAAAEREGPATLEAARAVVGQVRYDAVDLHLYDDYWSWPEYRDAVTQLATDAGRTNGLRFLVSEFGGPHPTLEPGGESFEASLVEDYVETLAGMGIERAYFFKLVEERGADIAHPNSFLIDADLRRTASFDVIRQAATR
ncbi:hypothetical protein [Rubrivirga sp.]|uniref:hypothetical protein n=1 Tax=Rubrivirga sp. TaxID=1885344 RepID=UPI003C754DE7